MDVEFRCRWLGNRIGEGWQDQMQNAAFDNLWILGGAIGDRIADSDQFPRLTRNVLKSSQHRPAGGVTGVD